jgi:hypothetical protein
MRKQITRIQCKSICQTSSRAFYDAGEGTTRNFSKRKYYVCWKAEACGEVSRVETFASIARLLRGVSMKIIIVSLGGNKREGWEKFQDDSFRCSLAGCWQTRFRNCEEPQIEFACTNVTDD